MMYDEGETVWFDQGAGPEKATVFTTDRERGLVAVLVGPMSMGDRYILDESEVYRKREHLEAES